MVKPDLNGPDRSVTFTIYGEPASKANSRRMVKIKGISALIKSHKALRYEAHFRNQLKTLLPSLGPPFEGDLHMDIDIWYGSRRPDLDESLVLDLLQQKDHHPFLYLNDRQVKSRRTRWGLDPADPRVTITIRPCKPEDYAGVRR